MVQRLWIWLAKTKSPSNKLVLEAKRLQMVTGVLEEGKVIQVDMRRIREAEQRTIVERKLSDTYVHTCIHAYIRTYIRTYNIAKKH